VHTHRPTKRLFQEATGPAPATVVVTQKIGEGCGAMLK